MSVRNTMFWVFLAAGLFGFIFFYQRHTHRAPTGPERILPGLKLSEVTSVQVRPAGSNQIELKIVAERTNNTWRLTDPLPYAAQAASIEDLLAALEQLTAVIHIPEAELKKQPKADEEYGFASPQASLMIWQGNQRTIVHIGARTSPGDQVYVEVVGSEGAFVVDADLLKHIPRSANDWRDTTLFSAERFRCDRIALTNNSAAFVTILQRDTNTFRWRMAWPLRARADSSRIDESLQALQNLRVKQFVSDSPKADLEGFGLAPPEFVLALGEGTNTPVAFEFGRALTNDLTQVYARRLGQNSVFTVAKDSLASWRTSSTDTFRDPILLRIHGAVDGIEGKAKESFALKRPPGEGWRISPGDLPVDANAMSELLSLLGGLQITEFVKDVVNPPDLPDYGLATPASSFLLQAVVTNSAGVVSNSTLAGLEFGFGTNQQHRVFARRTDENSVYAISSNDFARLPQAGWQLRERRFWQITTNDIARLTIQQKGKVRQLIRNGMYEWSFAPGSQGILPNVLAVEDTVRGLALSWAVAWVGVGPDACMNFGFKEHDYKLTLELKNGEKHSIEFGNTAPSENVYAAVTISGQPWVLEFPGLLYRDVQAYLSIPEGH
jgi:hypothetical protein